MQVLRDTTSHRFLRGYWKLRQHFVARVNPRLRSRYGLELPEVFLLHFSAVSDLSPGEIAGAMHLPPHAISRRLELLERHGLIERQLDPEDARRRVLRVTAKGQALLDEALGTLDESVNEVLGRLPEEALEPFIRALETLTDAEGADEAAPEPPETEETP